MSGNILHDCLRIEFTVTIYLHSEYQYSTYPVYTTNIIV